MSNNTESRERATMVRRLEHLRDCKVADRCLTCGHVRHNELGYCQVGQCTCESGVTVGMTASILLRDLPAETHEADPVSADLSASSGPTTTGTDELAEVLLPVLMAEYGGTEEDWTGMRSLRRVAAAVAASGVVVPVAEVREREAAAWDAGYAEACRPLKTQTPNPHRAGLAGEDR